MPRSTPGFYRWTREFVPTRGNTCPIRSVLTGEAPRTDPDPDPPTKVCERLRTSSSRPCAGASVRVGNGGFRHEIFAAPAFPAARPHSVRRPRGRVLRWGTWDPARPGEYECPCRKWGFPTRSHHRIRFPAAPSHSVCGPRGRFHVGGRGIRPDPAGARLRARPRFVFPGRAPSPSTDPRPHEVGRRSSTVLAPTAPRPERTTPIPGPLTATAVDGGDRLSVHRTGPHRPGPLVEAGQGHRPGLARTPPGIDVAAHERNDPPRRSSPSRER